MFNFKGTTLFYFLLLAVAFTFASCDEDRLQEDITPNAEVTEVQTQLNAVMGQALPPANGAAADSACFTFNFPVALVLEDGTTVSADNEDALAELFADAETSGNYVADFSYPLSLTLQDGSETSVESIEGLIELLTACYGEPGEWGEEGDHDVCPGDLVVSSPCFVLVYPITVVSGADQTTTEIADEAAFGEFLSTLDTTSLSVPFSFAFPFSVELLDGGETVEITSEEALTAVLEACALNDTGFEGGFDDGFVSSDSLQCFSFVYPLQITLGEGPVTINDEAEFIAVLEASEAIGFDFLYPLTVNVTSTDTEVVLESEDGWEAIFLSCVPDDGGFGGDDDGYNPNEGYGCFAVVFPLNLVVNGETITVETEEDLGAIFATITDPADLDIELDYPVTVFVFADSSTVAINNDEEWEALCDACHFDGDEGSFDDDCFTINYPLDVIISGETVAVDSDEAFEALITGTSPEDFGGFGFPLSVTITDTGDVVTVNNEEEFAALAQICE